MKLYIIGNGFDLHFKLPTRVDDFKAILANKRAYNYCLALDFFEGYGVDWSKYESSLADIDIDDFAEDHIALPDYTSDHESDRDWGITNIEYHVDYLNKAINESLEEMSKAANEELERISLSEEEKRLIEGEPIISFNYTSTIERLYHRDCFHIHGFYEIGELLVFGYRNSYESRIERQLNCDREEDHDYYVDTQKEVLIDFYHSWKKKLRMAELESYLSRLNGIDEVVVIGHSMGEVDSDYFELIERILRPKKWVVYYHYGIPNYGRYSFAEKVELKKW
ncbi:MAG: bacteriophage abortive infection AbiH family protein [Bacilli bacterium]|nr:bacteriophage abortive infection AbiH family protein [Bacilli bacterium]